MHIFRIELSEASLEETLGPHCGYKLVHQEYPYTVHANSSCGVGNETLGNK